MNDTAVLFSNMPLNDLWSEPMSAVTCLARLKEGIQAHSGL